MKNTLEKAHVVVNRVKDGVQISFFLDGTPSYLEPRVLAKQQVRELILALDRAADDQRPWDQPERIPY